MSGLAIFGGHFVRKTVSAAAAAVGIYALCVPASAWEHTKGEEDPFKGGSEHIAAEYDGLGFAIAVRCSSKADVALMFIAPEKPNELTLLGMLSGNPDVKLLVILDNEPKQAFAAGLEITPDGEHFRVSASGGAVPAMVTKIAKAQKRVAMAAEMNGKMIWSRSFGVRGASRSLDQLVDGCKLGQAATN